MRRGTYYVIRLNKPGESEKYTFDSISGQLTDITLPSGKVLHIGIKNYGKDYRSKGNYYYNATDLDSGMGILKKSVFRNTKELIEYVSQPDYLAAIDEVVKSDYYKDMVQRMNAFLNQRS